MNAPANLPRFTYSFACVCRLLGIEQRSRAWQSSHVRHLIENGVFPEPLPTRGAWRTRSQQWDRRAVDAWMDGRLSPAAAAQATAAAAQAAEALLAARAESLFAPGAGDDRRSIREPKGSLA
jgi:predicted DNA-binding transcriptional regulator AlpA